MITLIFIKEIYCGNSHMKKLMPILALLTFVFTLLMNYLSNTSYFTEQTVGDISDKYSTLITPAGYTFSIWGIIYIGLTAFVIYQLQPLWRQREEIAGVQAIRLLFIGTNLLNGIWILLWLNDQIGMAFLVIVLLFFHLLMILMNLNKRSTDSAYKWMVDYPFQLYAGWVTLAMIINIAVYLSKEGLAEQLLFNQSIWAIIILAIAICIYYAVVNWRRLIVFGLAGAWATAGIAVKQWDSYHEVGFTAAITSALILIFTARKGLR